MLLPHTFLHPQVREFLTLPDIQGDLVPANTVAGFFSTTSYPSVPPLSISSQQDRAHPPPRGQQHRCSTQIGTQGMRNVAGGQESPTDGREEMERWGEVDPSTGPPPMAEDAASRLHTQPERCVGHSGKGFISSTFSNVIRYTRRSLKCFINPIPLVC